MNSEYCISNDTLKKMFSSKLLGNVFRLCYKLSIFATNYQIAGPSDRVVKSADILLQGLMIRSSQHCVWLHAGHMRQAKFCSWMRQVVFLWVSPIFAAPTDWPSRMS